MPKVILTVVILRYLSIGVYVQSLPLNSSNILINGGLALDITLQATWLIEIGAVIFGKMSIIITLEVECLYMLTVMEYNVQKYTKKNQLLDEEKKENTYDILFVAAHCMSTDHMHLLYTCMVTWNFP